MASQILIYTYTHAEQQAGTEVCATWLSRFKRKIIVCVCETLSMQGLDCTHTCRRSSSPSTMHLTYASASVGGERGIYVLKLCRSVLFYIWKVVEMRQRAVRGLLKAAYLHTYIHTYLCIHHTHLPTQVNVDDRLAILRFNKFLQGRLKLPIHLLCLLQYVLTYIIIYIK